MTATLKGWTPVGYVLGLSGQVEHVVVRRGRGERAACNIAREKLQREAHQTSANGESGLCKRCVAALTKAGMVAP